MKCKLLARATRRILPASQTRARVASLQEIGACSGALRMRMRVCIVMLAISLGLVSLRL